MAEREQFEVVHSASSESGSISLSRREVMKGLALTAIAGGTTGNAMAQSAKAPPTNAYPAIITTAGDSVRASTSSPMVETEYGRIRGFVRNGIYTFKDVPYGAESSGANRFMPPKKPASWTGVRPCLHHGFVCPQRMRDAWGNQEEAWLFDWNDGIPSEDCLNLNVWTPALDDGKRPVMVWLHGGAFMAGSSIELPSYDGENLAHRGVVQVGVMHRLSILGFLNLAAFGEQYADSGNVGMLDIVAALEWVRDNIARFGGDPNRVTIYGQSGGGAKVTALMAMPSAKGLFHRGIVQSGSMLSAFSKERSNEMAEKVLKVLGIDSANVSKIQQLPVEEVDKAAEVASGPFQRMPQMWGPTAGTASLPEVPFTPKAPEISASVPLMVGSTLNESFQAVDKPDAFKMTQGELETRLRTSWKDKTDEVIRVFRKNFPNANNFQLWSVISASRARFGVLTQARRKAEQKAAPAYCYRFDWQSPVLEGRPMALHCGDIPFAFDNTARCANMTGNGPEARALAARMSEAWIHFAASGDPNHPGIPRWKPFDPATNGTMVLDNQCEFREHLDDECQNVIGDQPDPRGRGV